MNKKIILLFITLSFQIIQAQNRIDNFIQFENEKHQKIYQISFPGPPQTLELIKFNNGNFEGYLITILDKKRGRKTKEIVDIFKLESNLVKKIITELYNNNIETLTKCNLFEPPFDDCVGTLDGDSTVFKIITKSLNRKYSFDALWPGEKINPKFPEKQKNAQKLLNIIDGYIDLEEQFGNSFNRLINREGKGNYSYFSGNTTFLYRIRKQNIK